MSNSSSILPDEYILLEYLHKTGIAFADTLINQKNGIGIKISARFSIYNGSYQYIIGSYASNSDYIGIWKSSQSAINFCYKNTIAQDVLYDIDVFHTFSINYLNDGLFKLDDETVDEIEDTKEAVTPTILIGDTEIITHFDSEFDIGIVEITDGDEVIAKFIPCVRKNDNKVGFYDIIGERFIYNTESGTFTVGAIITDEVIKEIKVNQTIYDIQSKSVENKNQNNTDLPSTFDWVGTFSEYVSQNVEENHPEWLCYITDDIHDEDGSVDLSNYMRNGRDETMSGDKTFTGIIKSPTPDSSNANNTTVANTEWVNSQITSVLSALYPVGSLYIGTQNTCPLITLIPGSTWEIVGEGKALWGGNGTNGNSSIAAGLPNITGISSWDFMGDRYSVDSQNEGALVKYDGKKGNAPRTVTNRYVWTNGNVTDANSKNYLSFDASRCSAIYGNSTTVQPPAYRANMWRRTS